MGRYKAVQGSQSAHCCFTATVIDLARPDEAGVHEAVCECFEISWAAKIASALNTRETPLTFSALRSANVARCERWHPQGIASWSPSDWLTAAMGELGELASEVKMFNRERDGLVGNKEIITQEERKQRMAKEAADVVTYLDLFCAARGIDLGEAVAKKFNEVSERNGFPERLGGV